LRSAEAGAGRGGAGPAADAEGALHGVSCGCDRELGTAAPRRGEWHGKSRPDGIPAASVGAHQAGEVGVLASPAADARGACYLIKSALVITQITPQPIGRRR
jgi:hypothetical protein